MTSLYQQTVPPIIKYLKNLSGLLEKGVKFADEKGVKHEEMLNFRLAPDMRGLTYQVQSCSNTAKFIPVRLGVMDNVQLEDNETNFEQLQERITRTIEILRSLDESSWAGKETESLLMKTGMGDFKFHSGQEYVSNYALPNFHFHLCSAYCILRHLGVEIGAFDYLGKDTFVKV